MPQQNSQGDRPRLPLPVAILVADGSNPFEFACACEIFGSRRRAELGVELYDVRVVSAGEEVRMRDGLFTLSGAAPLTQLSEAHTVVVPNRPDVATPTHADVLDALRAAHRRGARLVGLCTGAFTLAEAGVLDGRPAAVHWQVAEQFRADHPGVDVRDDELFVDDGDVLTSAGSAAALDLLLHVVRKDHGATMANFVSRRLVYAGLRQGGQRQFVEHAVPPHADTALGPLLDWARERLAEPLTVTGLAARTHLSVATLHRRFQAELGTTPHQWLIGQRVDLALRLLEGTTDSVDVVAHASGLGTAANLRVLVKRRTGLSPAAYRAQFTLSPPRMRTAH